VRTRVDSRLRAEAETFAFRFSWDDCAHFEPTESACSLSFAAAPRRTDLDGTHLELCKAFELG
jgi:hypothetical protein